MLVVLDVERVLELARQEITGILRRHRARNFDAGLITAGALEQDQFRAELANQSPAFFAGPLRHQDRDWVTFGRAHHRECHAGVAARAFEDDRVGLEQTPLFGIEDHAFCKSILHAAAGIEEFALGEKGHAFLGKMQRRQLRVADERQHCFGARRIVPGARLQFQIWWSQGGSNP